MAINPSTKYSGQVSTVDPVGYPYGKAQNEAVSGDGTGTPLEADWISDWWGFAQALLDHHGVAPSGSPDKVGTSQYLDALTDSDWEWTGDHKFDGSVHVAAPPVYNAGIARQSWASMATAQTGWGVNGGWQIVKDNQLNVLLPATYAGVAFSAGVVQVVVPFRLPPGATLTKVTGVYFNGASSNCTMRVERKINSLTSPARGAVGAQVTQTSVSGQLNIATAALTSISNEINEYFVEFEFSAATSILNGVLIEWTDPGVQNQLR